MFKLLKLLMWYQHFFAMNNLYLNVCRCDTVA